MIRRVITAMAVLALIPAVASADWSNRLLDGHAGAISGMTGSTNFSGSGTQGVLDVDVDYAVFAPGTFPGSFTTTFTGGSIPGNHFVYAYQVYNQGAGQGGTSTLDVSELVINFSGGGPVGELGEDEDFDPATGDRNASFALNFTSSSSFAFHASFTGTLGVDEYSTVLLATSDKAPIINQVSSVVDGGLAVNGLLPTPSSVIPAPGASFLGLIGLGLVAGIRRRRS